MVTYRSCHVKPVSRSTTKVLTILHILAGLMSLSVYVNPSYFRVEHDELKGAVQLQQLWKVG